MQLSRFSAYLLVVLSSFFYATNPTLSKFAAEAGGNTDAFLVLRFAIAVFLLFVFCKILKKPVALPLKSALKVMAIGSIIYGVSFFYISAVRLIPAGLATVLLFTYPLWIVFFESVLHKRRPPFFKLMCMGLAFVGIIMLSVTSLKGDFNIKGLLFALIAALGLAFNALFGYSVTQKMNSFTVSFWMMVSCLMLSFLSFSYTSPLFPSTSFGFVCGASAAVFFCFGLLCFFLALPILGATESGFFNNLEPLMSLVLAYVFLNEKLGIAELIGAFIILSAVTLMSVLGAFRKTPLIID